MKNKVGNFFIRMIKGAAIGIAMIIPGLSAGTVSILTKIHQGIIDSVTNLHKQFKSSFLYLLPILLGAVIGFLGLA
jgi:putative membrane protein